MSDMVESSQGAESNVFFRMDWENGTFVSLQDNCFVFNGKKYPLNMIAGLDICSVSEEGCLSALYSCSFALIFRLIAWGCFFCAGLGMLTYLFDIASPIPVLIPAVLGFGLLLLDSFVSGAAESKKYFINIQFVNGNEQEILLGALKEDLVKIVQAYYQYRS